MKIEVIDNRGTDEAPYGYVYFSDDTRVAYTKAPGGPWRCHGTGGWGPVTAQHYETAQQHLETNGVMVPGNETAAA